MLQPWRMIQIAICTALIALSWLIARAAHPRLDAWMRERTMSKTQARLLILIRDRLMGLILAAATWGVALGMREITWPSRSYLIGVLAGLVTAWVLIGIASRMFRSRPLRQLVRRTGRVVASLALLGLLPHAIDLLDAAALIIGGTRVSMLLALKSAVIFVAPLWLANGVSRAAGGGPAARGARGHLPLHAGARRKGRVAAALWHRHRVTGLNAVGFDLTSLTIL
jgi:hypothetical protein